MKTLKNITACLLIAAIAMPAFAGSFGFGLTAPGSYSNNVTTTASTSVNQQGLSTSMGGAVTNQGPLGTFQAQYGSGTPPYGFNHSGTVAAGTYAIALTQTGSGFTAVSMSW